MAEKSAIAAALKANKEHQYALKEYTERLEVELKTVDKMIVSSMFYALPYHFL